MRRQRELFQASRSHDCFPRARLTRETLSRVRMTGSPAAMARLPACSSTTSYPALFAPRETLVASPPPGFRQNDVY